MLDLGQQFFRIVEREVTKFEVEDAVAGYDVQRRTAADHAGVYRRVWDVIPRIEPPALAKPPRHLREHHHDFACDLNCIDSARSQRRVHFVAADAAAVAPFPLVRDDRAHPGGLAHDTAGGCNATLAEIRDQPPHADAADLLVVR